MPSGDSSLPSPSSYLKVFSLTTHIASKNLCNKIFSVLIIFFLMLCTTYRCESTDVGANLLHGQGYAHRDRDLDYPTEMFRYCNFLCTLWDSIIIDLAVCDKYWGVYTVMSHQHLSPTSSSPKILKGL